MEPGPRKSGISYFEICGVFHSYEVLAPCNRHFVALSASEDALTHIRAANASTCDQR